MKIIDAHCHLWDHGFLPDRFLWKQAMRWAYGKTPFRDPDDIIDKIMPGIADPEGKYLISQMDEAGVDAAVILTMDYGLMMDEEPRASMDDIHRFYQKLTARYEGRVYAFAGTDPRRPDALDILRRGVEQFGCRGYKIYPSAGFYPFDPICHPLYEYCQANELPVISHVAADTPPSRARFSRPEYWADVIADFPDLTFWFGHAGGSPQWLDECLQMAAIHPNCYLEMSTWQVLAGRDEGAFVKTLARARDVVGAHRILFGTDCQYCRRFGGDRMFGMPLRQWVSLWHDLPAKGEQYGVSFTPEEVALMMGGNAERCLKLRPNDLPVRKFGWAPNSKMKRGSDARSV